MMKPKIALQLYTVRDLLKDDFEATVARIADIGYRAVETAGFPAGISATSAVRIFEKFGLQVCSAHTPLPLGDDKNRVLEMADALNCERIICAYLPPEAYQDADQVYRTCDRLNQAGEIARANGLAFGVHNHWWEFQKVGDAYPFEAWLKYLDPAIFFELDTYWIQTAGLDPALIVRQFGSRAPILHIKDGTAGDDTAAPMTAVGTGQLDFPAILLEASADWLVIELDRYEDDIDIILRDSLHYLSQCL